MWACGYTDLIYRVVQECLSLGDQLPFGIWPVVFRIVVASNKQTFTATWLNTHTHTYMCMYVCMCNSLFRCFVCDWQLHCTVPVAGVPFTCTKLRQKIDTYTYIYSRKSQNEENEINNKKQWRCQRMAISRVEREIAKLPPQRSTTMQKQWN